jgi:hypothetical protein
MKKSTFLKIAMAFSLMLLVSGAFAQIKLSVFNENGTVSVGAVIYTQNSSTGAIVPVVAVEAPAGTYTWTPAAGSYNYLVRNSLSNQYNAYSVTFVGPVINASITLSTRFTTTIAGTEYVANRTADKITNAKTLPFWVYPSPVHNPSWVVPAVAYASQAAIEQNVGPDDLFSSFSWTVTGAPANASLTNYVEITPNGNTSGSAIATSPLSLSVVETPAAAYGGCVGPTVKFYNTIINPPYAKITGTAASVGSTIGGLAYQVIGSGCDGDLVALTKNIALSFDNTNEEFPFYMRLNYNVYNPTIAGIDMTLGAALPAASFPAALRPQSSAGGPVADANQTTNPMMFSGPSYTPNVYAAAVTFTAVNNNVTVYEFDLNSWNGKISRKSDYIAFRTAAVPETVSSNTLTWYTNGAVANTFDASAFVKKAYVVVYPKPVTGPIYHIPNSWAL